jgi:hypothetical protein
VSIGYGEDFRTAVRRGLEECKTALVVIGEEWLSVTDETGKRRLDDSNDYVRIEISTALKSDLLVVPVLVHDTKMPTESTLPEDLKSISYRNAARVRDDPDFSVDMDRLCQQLRKHLHRKPLFKRPVVWGVLAPILALIVLVPFALHWKGTSGQPGDKSDIGESRKYSDRDGNLRRTGSTGALLWANGATIRIAFLDGDPALQERVKQVAVEWTKYANLKFEFGPVEGSDIRITFYPAVGGVWSCPGTVCLHVPSNEPTMGLATLGANPSEAELRRSVLFAFGHALGLQKESQNPNAKIPWNKEKVYVEEAKKFKWTKEEIDRNVLKPWGAKVFGIDKPFDPDSIMMPSIPPELTVGGFATTQTSKLSEGDKKFIARLYPGELSL